MVGSNPSPIFISCQSLSADEFLCSAKPGGPTPGFRFVDHLKVDPRIGPRWSKKVFDRERKRVLSTGSMSPTIILPDRTVIEGNLNVKIARALGIKKIPVFEISSGKQYRQPLYRQSNHYWIPATWIWKQYRKVPFGPRVFVSVPIQPLVLPDASILNGDHRMSAVLKFLL